VLTGDGVVLGDNNVQAMKAMVTGDSGPYMPAIR